jgi:hypothetical protein
VSETTAVSTPSLRRRAWNSYSMFFERNEMRDEMKV